MKLSRLILSLPLLLAGCLTLWAQSGNPVAQAPALPASPAAARPSGERSDVDQETVLRERFTALYRTYISGDIGAAAQMVAPESRSSFYRLRLDTLMAAKVASIQFAPTNDSAVVTATLTYRIPGTMLDMDFKENWKQIDGQWYFVLPDPTTQETPFGKMTFPEKVDPKVMEEMVQKQNKQVDPDQYVKALQRVQQEENAKNAAAVAAAEAKKQAEQAQSQQSQKPPAKNSKSKRKSSKPTVPPAPTDKAAASSSEQ